ncbi:MAG: hypothetical protein JWL63_12 [Rhodocyclales bacterium]|nr:hypothetical protein [Rhodocyclales bacterium]
MLSSLAPNWLAIVSTIGLSILCSALWDVAKPAGRWLFGKIINAISQRSTRVLDGIYRQAGRGYSERASIQVLILSIALVIGIFLAFPVVGYSHLYGEKRADRISAMAISCSKVTPDKMESCIEAASLANAAPYLHTSMLSGIFLSVMLLYRLMCVLTINGLVSQYRRKFTIARPELDQQVALEVERSYALIRTKADYDSIIKMLSHVASTRPSGK